MQSHQQEHLTLGPWEAILQPAIAVLVNAQQGVLLFHPEPGVRVCSQIHRLLTPHPQVSLCGETEQPVDTLVLLTYHALVTTENTGSLPHGQAINKLSKRGFSHHIEYLY